MERKRGTTVPFHRLAARVWSPGAKDCESAARAANNNQARDTDQLLVVFVSSAAQLSRDLVTPDMSSYWGFNASGRSHHVGRPIVHPGWTRIDRRRDYLVRTDMGDLGVGVMRTGSHRLPKDAFKSNLVVVFRTSLRISSLSPGTSPRVTHFRPTAPAPQFRGRGQGEGQHR